MDSVGWGFVIHSPIRNISMGIIRRGGINGSQIGVFTNVDLTKLFTQYNAVLSVLENSRKND